MVSHSSSQQRLLWVRAFLPPAGLLEGGGRRIARVLSLFPLEQVSNGENLLHGFQAASIFCIC